ncbi:MAG TPA: ACT domain-containing protein [Candidatus Polarisedimenticolaceae bacterium]|nr:ACT domain-containing protein [Candidatus Polarisedimenticolaceae bacterium]
MSLDLAVLPGLYAVCRLDPDAPVPPSLLSTAFVAIVRTADELSIVCPGSVAPETGRCERGWCCIKVNGNLPFDATGILASLASPLAEANIPIFAISTFDTDYLLVRGVRLEHALRVLEGAGHTIHRGGRA